MSKTNYCKFCEYTTNKTSNFKAHKNTNKHKLNKENTREKFECQYCKKILKDTSHKNRHYDICKLKPIIEIKDRYNLLKEKYNNLEKEKMF
jgi:hypothetical protein